MLKKLKKKNHELIVDIKTYGKEITKYQRRELERWIWRKIKTDLLEVENGYMNIRELPVVLQRFAAKRLRNREVE